MYENEIKTFLCGPDGSLKKEFPLILRKNKDASWVKAIYNYPGKTTTQKIYNMIHNLTESPKCSDCGANLTFSDFKDGYFCSSCKRKSLIPSAVETDKITDGHPKVISREEDFEHDTCSSSILTTNASHDEAAVLKDHGFDPKEWRITKMKHSMWNNGAKDLYSSSITVVKRTLGELSADDIRKRIDEAVNYKPPKEIYARKSFIDGEKVLIVPIADFHFGLLCDEDTSHNVYNMVIARDRLERFIDTIQNKYHKAGISELVITFGNDFFNSDNFAGTTTKGTPQDNEGQYFNIFDRGVNLAIHAVQQLSTLANHTTVISIQGNHDKQTSHALIAALYYKFAGSPKITVDASSDKSARYYMQYGKCLFGFGHETKPTDCARLMATETSEWSSSPYKTFFIAHLHHEESDEIGGVTVRRVPTMCGRSEWTNSCGFTDASMHAQAFLYSTTEGLLEMTNVEM